MAAAATLHRQGITQIGSAADAAAGACARSPDNSPSPCSRSGSSAPASSPCRCSPARPLSQSPRSSAGRRASNTSRSRRRASIRSSSLATFIGVLIDWSPIDPMRALFWSAVLNGLAAVPLMIAMMIVVSRHQVMGRFTASRAAADIGLGGDERSWRSRRPPCLSLRSKQQLISLHARYAAHASFFTRVAAWISTAAGQPLTFLTAVCSNRHLGGDRPDLPLFGHVAADHQHRHDDHHLPDGVPDPEQPEPRRRRHAGQARRAPSRSGQGAREVHRHRASDRPADRARPNRARALRQGCERQRQRPPRTPSTGCSSASDQLGLLLSRGWSLRSASSIARSSSVEIRHLLDRPDAVEGRTEHIQLTTGEEADRHNPFRHGQALTNNPNLHQKRA